MKIERERAEVEAVIAEAKRMLLVAPSYGDPYAQAIVDMWRWLSGDADCPPVVPE